MLKSTAASVQPETHWCFHSFSRSAVAQEDFADLIANDNEAEQAREGHGNYQQISEQRRCALCRQKADAPIVWPQPY